MEPNAKSKTETSWEILNKSRYFLLILRNRAILEVIQNHKWRMWRSVHISHEHMTFYYGIIDSHQKKDKMHYSEATWFLYQNVFLEENRFSSCLQCSRSPKWQEAIPMPILSSLIPAPICISLFAQIALRQNLLTHWHVILFIFEQHFYCHEFSFRNK